jgi:hypothetical protein
MLPFARPLRRPAGLGVLPAALLAANPPYGGEVTYGDRAEHCWNGDPTRPNWASRLRYHQLYAPKIVARILKSAPPGADLTSWRY